MIVRIKVIFSVSFICSYKLKNIGNAESFHFNFKRAGKTMNEGLIIDDLRCSIGLGKTLLGAKS